MKYSRVQRVGNQYRNRRKHRINQWVSIGIIVLPITMITTLLWYGNSIDKVTHPHLVYANVIEPTATPKPTNDEHGQIVSYIEQTFGSDAPKAFKLLSCENSSYGPNRVNTAGNFPKGSRDIGIFQINEYWQNVNAKFLFNWKINIDIAHQLYTENGNTFKLWTCGRRLEI